MIFFPFTQILGLVMMAMGHVFMTTLPQNIKETLISDNCPFC
jgi:hypothetical protein